VVLVGLGSVIKCLLLSLGFRFWAFSFVVCGSMFFRRLCCLFPLSASLVSLYARSL